VLSSGIHCWQLVVVVNISILTGATISLTISLRNAPLLFSGDQENLAQAFSIESAYRPTETLIRKHLEHQHQHEQHQHQQQQQRQQQQQQQ